MSLGSIIGGVVGGVVGFFVGGPVGAAVGFGIGFGVGAIIDPLTPDVPTTGSPNPEETVMLSSIGDPVKDLCGTGQVAGHLLAFGGERSETEYAEAVSGGKGGAPEPAPQSTGERYFMSWAVGLLGCPNNPVDVLYAIYKNNDSAPVWPLFESEEEALAWEGIPCPDMGGMETIVIKDIGSINFYFGTDDQALNANLGPLLEDPTLNVPYRYLCWAFFDDCYIGKTNRAPTYKFVFKKMPQIENMPYKTEIDGYDCNPSHVEYYIMSVLCGLPTTWLNDDAFIAMSNVLFNENRGISILFDKQNSALSYLEVINNHIDAIIRYGSDAQFHPKLIRNDYSIDDLLEVNEKVLLEPPSFQRGSWNETVNELKVQYNELYDILRYDEVPVGKVYGCGRGIGGRLATGNEADQWTLTKSNSDKEWKCISCGEGHTVAIDEDDYLYGCGYSMWGTYEVTPIASDGLALVRDDIKWSQVSAGNNVTLGVSLEGRLMGTGQNTHGKLGVGDADVRFAFEQVADGFWTKVVCGANHSLAIRSDGTLWGCGMKYTLGIWDISGGSNYNWTQLGVHPNDPPGLAYGWTDIAAGSGSSYALKGSSLYYTGTNFDGQSGDGKSFTEGGISQYEYWFEVGISFSQIFGGMTSHALGIKGGSGNLYGVGKGTQGQLGIGDSETKSTWTPLGINAIIAGVGGTHSHAVDLDGKLHSCGYSSFGELGFGSPAVQSIPDWTQVDDNQYADVKAGGYFMVATRRYA